MMLIRSDNGQLMLVSQQALAQAQQAPRGISGQAPRILTPQVCVCTAFILFKGTVNVLPTVDRGRRKVM